MYRQITVKGLGAGARTLAAEATAYSGVQAAWQDYLAHDNDGRGVILIGHSQGAGMLISLLERQIDDVPSVRKLLVSAMILGGNVTVPTGQTVGGSFQHVPACTSDTQTGCVIAYSSFDQAPPADSLFGRPGQGVSNLSNGTATTGVQVLCTNPADLSGNAATPLTPYFPTKALVSGLGGLGGLTPPALGTPWLTEPDLYSGQCLSQGGATWLQVSAPITPGDTRQLVGQTLGPTWGLHLVDVNIALGNLVDLARSESAAFAATSGSALSG
jgi:pimeloyl-ACP methyl ester carboxylesterase